MLVRLILLRVVSLFLGDGEDSLKRSKGLRLPQFPAKLTRVLGAVGFDCRFEELGLTLNPIIKL